MAKKSVKVKFNNVSINVATLYEAAIRNKRIVDRMETAYKRDIAPIIAKSVQDYTGALHVSLRDNFNYGIVSNVIRKSFTVDGTSEMLFMDTDWEPLSPKTTEIKGHSRFWSHTKQLAQSFNSVIMSADKVKVTKTGVDKRRSRSRKGERKTPLVLATTISLPKTGNEFVDAMVLKNFVGGYDRPSRGPSYRGLGFSELYDAGGLQTFNGRAVGGTTSGLQHMALAEAQRPFIQDWSHIFGSTLANYLESRKLWK
ncbi:hypothetical protein [Endozoicomonas sp. ALC066]|uniref:hypothetical protein n=1 Tax=Endozoicomonas sp. ALC066 TaxID=3403078 RepID=UPI003BB6C1DC